jgi:hypothetical protein
MFSRILKWSAGCVGVVGGALFVNYVSSPPVDIWAIREKEIGKRPTPLVYPADMKTQWTVKLANSIGDTAYKLFGVELFLISPKLESILKEMKPYLTPTEYIEYVKVFNLTQESLLTQDGVTPCYRLIMLMMRMRALQARLAVEKEWQKKKEEVEKTTLKQQIIITGIPHIIFITY